ncbi:MAG: glycosyltransferase family 4 protein [Pseudomonadota bacterium]|nr:glycosyltransferase family 4 protein [Pseudomonadota bacterium]
MGIEWFLVGLVLGTSLLGTLGLRRYAIHRQLIDVPNRRSSHTRPTPRGGGVAIVIAFLAGFSGLYALGHMPHEVYLALSGAGLLVAVVGFWDDHSSLPARLRIAVHGAAAVWALYCLGGMPVLELGFARWEWGWFGQAVAAVGLVWLLNLFNFMDGIDGIAASEAIFVALAAALLAAPSGLQWGLVLLAVSCAGFLVLNWPPARIFMGDAGSGFLGFMLGGMAIAAAGQKPSLLWVWTILLGVFLVDASVTLIRRISRGVRWYEAHRSHAYQIAARRWASHKKVTLAVMAINIGWLLPLAGYAAIRPQYGPLLTALALAPLVAMALTLGAGGPEQPAPPQSS